MAVLTRKIFISFVLPVGLKNMDWTPGDRMSVTWYKNLIADIQTSRIIRHVLRENNARAQVFPDHPKSARKFFFRDNVSILAENRDGQSTSA